MLSDRILLSSSTTAGALGLIIGLEIGLEAGLEIGLEAGFASVFFSSSAFLVSVTTTSFSSLAAGCSSTGLFTTGFLRGRPTFFFGAAAGVSAAGVAVSCFTGAASCACALVAVLQACWQAHIL